MSATPIPRTLEMAVTGIREMSTIATPPEDRLPVLTFVGPYDDRQVGAAIRRELARDGQVFFVHNRVESIGRVATRISDLVLEARIAVAHGQMNGRPRTGHRGLLGEAIRCAGEYHDRRIRTGYRQRQHPDRRPGRHVSDCRTVASAPRSGWDADGSAATPTSSYNPDRVLTETAHERLATIAQHTDLVPGTAVAMKTWRDPGREPARRGTVGHIADVGFDLYMCGWFPRRSPNTRGDDRGGAGSDRAPAERPHPARLRP